MLAVIHSTLVCGYNKSILFNMCYCGTGSRAAFDKMHLYLCAALESMHIDTENVLNSECHYWDSGE